MEKAWHGVHWEIGVQAGKGLCSVSETTHPLQYYKGESGTGTLGNPGQGFLEEDPRIHKAGDGSNTHTGSGNKGESWLSCYVQGVGAKGWGLS